ncbi:MAG TPA: hypothetical protein VKB76_07895 [Ktedonobacterales bacterium]|nr:hypothetical protein [Ktedonobacterales bacterium]
MTRDQCINMPAGGSNRYWKRSNQPCPLIKSRTWTSRMASSVDMASKTPPLIDGNAIATVAASHNTGIKTFGLMPSRRSFSADWPEVELRADMASSLALS